MMVQKRKISLPQAPANELAPLGQRILGDRGHHAEKSRSFSKPLRTHYIGTLNVQTLLKTGKVKQLTNTLEKFNIKILALQETRFSDEDHFNTGDYRIYKGKPAIRKHQGICPTLFGTGFAVHKSVLNNIENFNSTSERISTLTFSAGNKSYTLINTHAPTNERNRTNPQETEDFWEHLEEVTNKIPTNHVKILL